MIIAVDGPAGVGKSTFIDTVMKPYVEDYYLPHRPDYPRQRSLAYGAFSSSLYDFDAVLHATLFPKQIVICDRFLISRWVYKYLDEKSEPMPPVNVWYKEIKDSWHNLQRAAIREANLRDRIDVRCEPTVTLHVLRCDINRLEAQRQASGKEYPFSATVEDGLFYLITSTLIEWPIRGLNVVVHYNGVRQATAPLLEVSNGD